MSNLKKPPKPERHEHPSYGMISFSRIHNSAGARDDPMFGSSLDKHYGAIMMTVRGGAMEHDLHRDRYFGSGPEYIRLEMTSAQFVEAITAMNQGDGVPCTIRHLRGETIPRPPVIDTEVERVRAKFEGDLKTMTEVLHERRAEIEKLADKLPAKAKEKLQQLTSNIPFVLNQFNEAAERVVTAAKHEIESFAQHRINMAGLEALGVPERAALPSESYHSEPCTNCSNIMFRAYGNNDQCNQCGVIRDPRPRTELHEGRRPCKVCEGIAGKKCENCNSRGWVPW